MPTVLLEPISVPDEPPARKRWTREEVECLDSMELFADQHYELIDGELINKMGKKRTHVLPVLRLRAWLISIFGLWRVENENPIDVSPEDNPTNEPEPDLVVLRESSEKYPKLNPGPRSMTA